MIAITKKTTHTSNVHISILAVLLYKCCPFILQYLSNALTAEFEITVSNLSKLLGEIYYTFSVGKPVIMYVNASTLMNSQTIINTSIKLWLLYYTELIVQPAPKASYNIKC